MTHDNSQGARPIWRFIIHPPLSPARNMAIDEAIALSFAEHRTRPTLRLYQWNAPTLTLGSFQKIDPVLRHFLETNKVTPMRRITGGLALLHDRDLTYSIIASTHDPLFSGGIKKTFYSIAQGLLAGLARLGITAFIHTPPPRDAASSRGQRAPQATVALQGQRPLRERSDLVSKCEREGEAPLALPMEGATRAPVMARNPFCAASLSWYEIEASEKKLIGSAQRRWIDHFLQHGSIPLERSPLEEKRIGARSIALCDLLNKLPTLSAIEEDIRLGFETAWPIQFMRGALTPQENQLADSLVTKQYSNAAWTEERKKREQIVS